MQDSFAMEWCPFQTDPARLTSDLEDHWEALLCSVSFHSPPLDPGQVSHTVLMYDRLEQSRHARHVSDKLLSNRVFFHDLGCYLRLFGVFLHLKREIVNCGTL
ncbi:hypothetical protein BaRGS_00007827 [Batillaria attramentaria]|uniref:Uncharacterized protein n=1 Tax=Batillaria attramentaria TaxID=370345 RepID=A0ABD0LNN3_9CAEN